MNLIFELKILGFITESYWIDSALYIGSALEAIILSFSLASKINFYKREKELIQEKAYQQAVNFSRDLINMQEQERKRIATELHDSVGQKLIVIKNKVLRFTKTGSSGFQQNPEGLAESVADAIQEIRSISYGLRPYQIDLLGLAQSIKSLVAESFDTLDISYSLQIDQVDDIKDPDLQINIYRIIQECINNISKHSGAKQVAIDVKREGGVLYIHIEDDGIGFDPKATVSGFGLKGIRERLHIMHGTIEISNAAPRGTFFKMSIPVK
jgi:signal transduction histidine kinase